MTTIELSPGCEKWQVGDATKHPPVDAAFLDSLTQAGFTAFIGPGGMCGGKTETRSAIAIHRGRGTKWELIFRENEADVVTTMTTDLGKATASVLAWLQGRALAVDADSLHAIAG